MAPAADSVRLRAMRPADLPRIARLEPVLFGPEAWSLRTYEEELAQPQRRYVVALAHHEGGGERLVGYAGLSLGPDAQVMTVGVDPAHRRRGIARRMLRTLVATAAEDGSKRVLLEVRADDAGALALYASEGFVLLGRRRGYYQHVGVDALVLVRPLHREVGAARQTRGRNPGCRTSVDPPIET